MNKSADFSSEQCSPGNEIYYVTALLFPSLSASRRCFYCEYYFSECIKKDGNGWLYHFPLFEGANNEALLIILERFMKIISSNLCLREGIEIFGDVFVTARKRARKYKHLREKTQTIKITTFIGRATITATD